MSFIVILLKPWLVASSTLFTATLPKVALVETIIEFLGIIFADEFFKPASVIFLLELLINEIKSFWGKSARVIQLILPPQYLFSSYLGVPPDESWKYFSLFNFI